MRLGATAYNEQKVPRKCSVECGSVHVCEKSGSGTKLFKGVRMIFGSHTDLFPPVKTENLIV